MEKFKIALVKLGYSDRLVNFDKIKKWKSDIFEVVSIQSLEMVPSTTISDGYLDVKYTKESMKDTISCPRDSDFAIAIMPYRFEDNFYMHRIRNNCVVISLYGIIEILESKKISVENFIVNQLYSICSIAYLVQDISSIDAYQLKHRDTRGCIFDLNGDKENIVFNTEKPTICDECKAKFRSRQIDEKIVLKLEKEFKKIRKPLILRIEKWIQKYPFLSVLISGIVAILLNIIASIILDISKTKL